MHNYSLIRSIISEPWAISELSIDAHFPLIAGLFDKNIAFEKGATLMPEIRSFGADASAGSVARNFNVSVITIKGAMTKDDQECGPAGMATMTNWLNQADNNPSVDVHAIKFDTPGGTVVGTQEFGDAIKACKKPVIAFVDDQCCSGGYWLASQCAEIIANNNYAQVGSIGVMMTFPDVQPHYESLGVKFHTIKAPQSSEKNKTIEDLRAGNYEQYKNEVLAPLCANFISIVKDGRSGVEESQLKGAVYFAHSVVGSLVDSIGNFDYALSRAAALAEKQSADISNTNASESTLDATATTETVEQKPTIEMKKTINKVAGATIGANAAGNLELTPEQAEAVEQALVSAEELATTISDRDATIAAQLIKITELEKKPGAETTVAVAELDGADAAEKSPLVRVTEFFDSLK
jgi:ClpP class serine protease